MNVLVIGSGGREHAIAWKLSQSPLMTTLFCSPGNAATASLGENVLLNTSDHEAVIAFCQTNSIDLAVVGPEAPLVDGLADSLRTAGIGTIGPSASGAQLEGSKLFSKEVMESAGLPTAKYAHCDNLDDAKTAAASFGIPVVIKADGLAAGKGVVVCTNQEMVNETLNDMFVDKVFGDAGQKVVVEECLFGEEASYIILLDGEHWVPLASSQDHKPVFDNDRGLNTGGMGAYSPAPVLTEKLEQQVNDSIVAPLVAELKKRQINYSGFLYIGLMITADGPKVLEFNVRLGDPETQPLLFRLKSDLLEVFNTMVTDGLEQVSLSWYDSYAVCIVMASGGYPGSYEKGHIITGLDAAATVDQSMVFHAGTALKDGDIVTSGGRVLSVTAMGDTLGQAIDRAYTATRSISWPEVHYRTDIGAKGMRHLRQEK